MLNVHLKSTSLGSNLFLEVHPDLFVSCLGTANITCLPKLHQIVFALQKANLMCKGMSWTRLEFQNVSRELRPSWVRGTLLILSEIYPRVFGGCEQSDNLYLLCWLQLVWYMVSFTAVRRVGLLAAEKQRTPGCFRFGQHSLSFTTALFGRNCWNQRRCSTLQVLIAEALRPLKGGGRALTHLSSSAFTHKILSGASVGVLGAYPYCLRQWK